MIKIKTIIGITLSLIPLYSSAETVTLAGGCFWCTEADMEKFLVTDVISGYSGGRIENPTYKQVSSGETMHIESIQFEYDSSLVTYKDVLDHFIRHIDPTDKNGSFYDRGFQYSPAIFYHSIEQKNIAKEFIAEIDKLSIYDKKLEIKLMPYSSFWNAEDYHQDYYKKNPIRYSYYRHGSGRDKYIENIFKGKDDTLQELISFSQEYKYKRPSDKVIKETLTKKQYKITQKDGTERPFDNEYWDNKEKGIYVDIVSGEPLFSSIDKYKSGTGWPSFSKPLESKYIVEKEDNTLFSKRIEIRSKIGDSHLGHVFNDGPPSTGLRYCMNSAALRFIPLSEMKKEGYEEYIDIFK